MLWNDVIEEKMLSLNMNLIKFCIIILNIYIVYCI